VTAREIVVVPKPNGDAESGAVSVLSSFNGLSPMLPGVLARSIEADDSSVGVNDSVSLQQEVLADLRRGSGAIVIAASGGYDFAYEGGGVKNGTFTAAVLEGLNGAAGSNDHGAVRVSELRDYVDRRVVVLTGNGRGQSCVKRTQPMTFLYIENVTCFGLPSKMPL
jgi:hypothetical protein